MTKKKEMRNKALEEEMKKNLFRRNSKKKKILSLKKVKGVKNDNNV
tara:strand:+ start:10496 stop:10633 length:138 start_codon:yes stop_codon:yes gene_type:complete